METTPSRHPWKGVWGGGGVLLIFPGFYLDQVWVKEKRKLNLEEGEEGKVATLRIT